MTIIDTIGGLLQAFFGPLRTMWEEMFRIRFTSWWLFDSFGDMIVKIVMFLIVITFVYQLWRGGSE